MSAASLRTSLLLVLWGVAGCDALEYTPGGEPFTEVLPLPQTGEAGFDIVQDTVGLFNVRTDLVRRYWRPTLNYVLNYDAVGPRVRFEASLDGERIEVEDSRTWSGGGRLTIMLDELEAEARTFRLRVYAPSSTGSLADRYGLIADVERPVVVDDAAPSPVAIRSVAPEGGVLTLRWDRYRRPNFQAYSIYELSSPNSSYPRFRARVESADTLVWRDSSYTAGERFYRVDVIAAGQRTAGESWGVEYPAPSLVRAVDLGDNRRRFVWTSTPFYESFEQYVITRWYYGGDPIATFDSIADTSATVHDPDGASRYSLLTETTHGVVESESISVTTP